MNFWWEQEGIDAAKSLNSTVEAINRNQAYREQDNLASMRYYGGLEYLGFGIGSYSRVGAPSGKIGMNAIRSCVDTVTAKIAKNKIKPTFTTNDRDWELYRKAKNFDMFGQGLFYDSKFHTKSPIVFRDAAIFGTGAMKCYQYNNGKEQRVGFERTFINEIKFDDGDAINGEPRTMYQEKAIARDVARGVWKKHKEAIDEASAVENAFIDTHMSASEQIHVREAWHLPSYPGAGDGRHVVAIDGALLFSEKWERDNFPFAFIRWSNPLLGFFGTGISHELADIQYEINFILQRIQEAHRMLGVPMIFYDRSSDFPVEQLTNAVANAYPFTDKAPTFITPPMVAPELYAHLDRLWARAFELAGVSQLSASSRKPSGLDSGAALREFNDIESERFMMVGQQYEQLAVDCMTLALAEAKDIAEKHGEYRVVSSGKMYGRRFVKELVFKPADFNMDGFHIQVQPTSSLPTTPVGKRQELAERINMGMITPEDAADMMDLPDTEAQNSTSLAARHDLEEMFYDYLYDDNPKYRPPEPFQDLTQGLRIGQIRYLQAKSSNCPDERLGLVRRWMGDAKAILDSLAPPPAPPMPEMAPPVEGAPL